MSPLWITLVLGALSVGLFIAELIPPAMVSLLVMGTLMLTGVLSPEAGLSGLSNEATVTVGAMFVLSAGLDNTGALRGVATYLGRILSKHYRLGWLGLLVATGLGSAFINNTAVVAMLIPILISCARDADVSPSKLLMPVSFVSMFGGMCTLLGTSTNLIVSSVAHDHGLAPLSMFELAPLGVPCFVAGVAYLALTAKWMPKRRSSDEELTEGFSMGAFLSVVRVLEGSKVIGKRLQESMFRRGLDLDVLAVIRDGEGLTHLDDVRLQAGDVLRVRGRRRHIEAVHRREGIVLDLARVDDAALDTKDAMLIEAVVTPRSKLAGRTLDDIALFERLGAVCLAVRQRGELHHRRLVNMKLAAGDVLLLALNRSRRQQLDEAGELMVISHQPLETPRTDRIVAALVILFGVVLSAALDWLPIAISAPVGAMAMVLTGCIELDEAYQRVDWDVIFLLGGMLALGVAFQQTGAGRLLAGYLVDSAGALGAHGVIAALYIVTLLLTSTMSNNATAALLTPIAISVAANMDVDPRPLIVTVAIAASASFLTPIGYQTNTMVYGAGHYRFGDFVRIGGPLSLLFWGLATLLVPAIWPL